MEQKWNRRKQGIKRMREQWVDNKNVTKTHRKEKSENYWWSICIWIAIKKRRLTRIKKRYNGCLLIVQSNKSERWSSAANTWRGGWRVHGESIGWWAPLLPLFYSNELKEIVTPAPQMLLFMISERYPPFTHWKLTCTNMFSSTV